MLFIPNIISLSVHSNVCSLRLLIAIMKALQWCWLLYQYDMVVKLEFYQLPMETSWLSSSVSVSVVIHMGLEIKP